MLVRSMRLLMLPRLRHLTFTWSYKGKAVSCATGVFCVSVVVQK